MLGLLLMLNAAFAVLFSIAGMCSIINIFIVSAFFSVVVAVIFAEAMTDDSF